MEKLNKEEVLKVLNLAKLDENIEDIEKLSYQLKEIMNEINRIEEIDINDGEILISPTKNINVYYKDEVGEMLNKSEVLKNASNHDDTYIEVVGVLND